MSTSHFKLAAGMRTRLTRELQPGEQVVWAATPQGRRHVLAQLPIGAFSLMWTVFSGALTVAVAASALGVIPFRMNGQPSTSAWAALFAVLPTLFFLFGLVMLYHVWREMTAGWRRIHAITDRRLLTLETDRSKPLENRARSSVNFVRATRHGGRTGALIIAVGIDRDVEGSPKPETLTWPGISDIDAALAAFDQKPGRTTIHQPRATISPDQNAQAALASLPTKLARDVAHETRGERIEWVGQPDATRAAKWAMLAWLFALPWLYLTVKWELTAVGLLVQELSRSGTKTPIVWLTVMALWGLPFVAIGLSMLAAPYWIWLKARSFAAVVTDRRIVTLQRDRRRGTTVSKIDPSQIVSVTGTAVPPGGRGTIRIVLGKTVDSDGDITDQVETLWWVNDPDRAVALIEALRTTASRDAA